MRLQPQFLTWLKIVSLVLLIGGTLLLIVPTLLPDPPEITQEVPEPTPVTEDSVRSDTNTLLALLSQPKPLRNTVWIQELRSAAAKRQNSLSTLLEHEPASAYRLVLPEELRAQVEEAAGAEYIEQRVSMTGLLSVVITHGHTPTDLVKSDFANIPNGHVEEHRNETDIWLTDEKDNTRHLLFLADENIGRLRSNIRVTVDGFKVGTHILVAPDKFVFADNLDSSRIAEGSTSPNVQRQAYVSSGNRTILAVLVNFTDLTSQPATQATVQQRLFGSSNSVNSYYNTASYGAISFSGEVTPWLTMNTTVGGTCDYYAWTDHAITSVTNQGYTLENYDHVMFIFPFLGVCPYAGLGMLYGGITWAFGYTTLQNLGHEIGHNLGLDHAGGYSCGAQQIAPPANCSFSQYANPWDLMGNQATFDLTVQHKFGLGFIPLSDVRTITQNGTYTVAPLGSSSGVRALKIRRPDTSQDYYIEYRQPIGLDATISANATRGIAINLWSPSYYGLSYPAYYSSDGYNYMLDLTPGSGGGFTDGTLSDGGTFTDSANGITVTQVSHNGSGATVSVAFSGAVCSPANLTSSLTPESQTAPPGSPLTYTLSVTNNDNPALCGIANLTFLPSVPSGWTGTVSVNQAVLAPGATTQVTVTVTSPVNAGNSIESVGIQVLETGVSAHTKTETRSFVVYSDAPPPTPTPTPTPTPSPPTPPPVTEDTTRTQTPAPATPTPTSTPGKTTTTTLPTNTPTSTTETPEQTPEPTTEPTVETSISPQASETPSISPELLEEEPLSTKGFFQVINELPVVQKIGFVMVVLGLFGLLGFIWISSREIITGA